MQIHTHTHKQTNARAGEQRRRDGNNGLLRTGTGELADVAAGNGRHSSRLRGQSLPQVCVWCYCVCLPAIMLSAAGNGQHSSRPTDPEISSTH